MARCVTAHSERLKDFIASPWQRLAGERRQRTLQRLHLHAGIQLLRTDRHHQRAIGQPSHAHAVGGLRQQLHRLTRERAGLGVDQPDGRAGDLRARRRLAALSLLFVTNKAPKGRSTPLLRPGCCRRTRHSCPCAGPSLRCGRPVHSGRGWCGWRGLALGASSRRRSGMGWPVDGSAGWPSIALACQARRPVTRDSGTSTTISSSSGLARLSTDCLSSTSCPVSKRTAVMTPSKGAVSTA